MVWPWREVTTTTTLRGQVEGGGQGGDLHQGRLGIVTQGEGGNIKTPQSENNPPVFSLSVNKFTSNIDLDMLTVEEDQDDILLLFCLWRSQQVAVR